MSDSALTMPARLVPGPAAGGGAGVGGRKEGEEEEELVQAQHAPHLPLEEVKDTKYLAKLKVTN